MDEGKPGSNPYSFNTVYIRPYSLFTNLAYQDSLLIPFEKRA